VHGHLIAVESALNAAHTSGWIRMALPSTSTGSNALYQAVRVGRGSSTGDRG